ncbi:hypothetical protein Dimus_036564 [Dionaea muscipula]
MTRTSSLNLKPSSASIRIVVLFLLLPPKIFPVTSRTLAAALAISPVTPKAIPVGFKGNRILPWILLKFVVVLDFAIVEEEMKVRGRKEERGEFFDFAMLDFVVVDFVVFYFPCKSSSPILDVARVRQREEARFRMLEFVKEKVRGKEETRERYEGKRD